MENKRKQKKSRDRKQKFILTHTHPNTHPHLLAHPHTQSGLYFKGNIMCLVLETNS